MCRWAEGAAGDAIIDFRHGLDAIGLSRVTAGGDFIGRAGFTGEDDQVRHTRTNGRLQGDGEGRADWSVTILSKALLTDADIDFQTSHQRPKHNLTPRRSLMRWKRTDGVYTRGVGWHRISPCTLKLR